MGENVGRVKEWGEDIDTSIPITDFADLCRKKSRWRGGEKGEDCKETREQRNTQKEPIFKDIINIFIITLSVHD